MLSALAGWVANVLTAHGNLGLAVLMALESMGAPIPAEVVLPFAGYLVFAGRLGFVAAVAAATAGSLAGFLVQYAVGRAHGRALILRYGRYILITPRHLDATDRWFARYGDRAVLVARLLPVVRGLISLPAGTSGMPLVRFAVWSVVGALPWSVGLIGAGWVLGDLWPVVTRWAHRGSLAMGLAAAGLVALAAWLRWRRRLRSRRSGPGPVDSVR